VISLFAMGILNVCMNPITISDREVRVHADSRIEPFARWLRNQDIPKAILAYWGQNLIRNLRDLGEFCEDYRRILAEIAVTLLFYALDYTIVIQKSLSAHAEAGASVTAKLSSE